MPDSPIARASRNAWRDSLLVTLVVFVATLPTLSWLEFSGSMENLNVATVLEMHRTRRWIVPTLEGDARLNKPPLTAWVTALFVSDAAIDRLNAADPAARESAYRALAFRVRLAPLLQSALTMLLLAALAKTALGDGAAPIAAAVYGTSLLVLKIGHSATTDVMMTLWIAVAQLGVAIWLFRSLRWRGAVLIGIGTGLALMSKGPVCLLFIVLPALVFAAFRAWLTSSPSTPGEGREVLTDKDEGGRMKDENGEVLSSLHPSAFILHPYDKNPHPSLLPAYREKGPVRRVLGPLLLAIGLALAIGTPWFLYVYAQHHEVVRGWTTEVTRVGATENASTNPVFYLAIVLFLLPWLPFAIAAGVEAVRGVRHRQGDDTAIPSVDAGFTSDVLRKPPRFGIGVLVWLLIAGVLPLVVMSFFPDRKDRYALPAMIPLALLAAHGVQTHLTNRRLARIHYTLLLILAIALPLAGATVLKRLDGPPWFSPMAAGLGAAAMLAVVSIGLREQRRRPMAAVVTTLIVLMIAQALATHGYCNSRSGRSEMKPLAESIRRAVPDAGRIINGRRDRKRMSVDLAIYLNRSTEREPNWPALSLSDPPTIVILQQRPGESDPIAPPGWKVLDRAPRDTDWYWVLAQSK